MIKFVECSHKILRLPLLFSVSHASYKRSTNQVIRICLKDSNSNFHRTDILLRDYVNGANVEASVDYLHEFFRANILSHPWSSLREVEGIEAETERRLLSLWKKSDTQNNLSVFSALDLIIREAVSERSESDSDALKRQLSSGLWVLPLMKEAFFRAALRYTARLSLPIKVKMPSFASLSHSWMSSLQEYQQGIRVIDFNASWSKEDAVQAIAAYPFLKHFVWEQCLSKELPIEEHIRFHQSIGVDFMLDESLCRLQDAENFAKVRQVNQKAIRQFWNLRIAKNGGITGVKYLHSEARRQQVLCHLGCFVGEGRLLRKYHKKMIQNLELSSFDKNPGWLSPFGI